MSDVELSEKERIFVEHYLKNSDPEKAAIAAGYPKAAAKNAAKLLLTQSNVRSWIEKSRRENLGKTQYDHVEFIKELDQGMRFAKQRKNAAAYVRAVELKGKAHGLLIERHEVKQQGFQVIISGIDDQPKEVAPVKEELLPPKKTDESGD